MKRLAILVLIVAVLDSCHRKEATTSHEASDSSENIVADTTKKTILDKYPLLTWMRKNPAEIGCILQTELGYRDSVFNCDYKNYTNKSNPCDDETRYYEGVDLPDSLASKINPAFQQFAMDFEQGSLQQLTITFNDSLSINKIKEMFHLPLQKDSLPENVMGIDFGENVSSKDKPVNSDYTRWLIISGFEHMGAGDVDCN